MAVLVPVFLEKLRAWPLVGVIAMVPPLVAMVPLPPSARVIVRALAAPPASTVIAEAPLEVTVPPVEVKLMAGELTSSEPPLPIVWVVPPVNVIAEPENLTEPVAAPGSSV